MIITKPIYQVGNFEFEDLKHAKNFDKYLTVFSEEQLDEIHLGYQSEIDYTIYAKPEFSAKQMEEIRRGLEDGIDVTSFTNPELSPMEMFHKRWYLKYLKDTYPNGQPFSFKNYKEKISYSYPYYNELEVDLEEYKNSIEINLEEYKNSDYILSSLLKKK